MTAEITSIGRFVGTDPALTAELVHRRTELAAAGRRSRRRMSGADPAPRREHRARHEARHRLVLPRLVPRPR